MVHVVNLFIFSELRPAEPFLHLNATRKDIFYSSCVPEEDKEFDTHAWKHIFLSFMIKITTVTTSTLPRMKLIPEITKKNEVSTNQKQLQIEVLPSKLWLQFSEQRRKMSRKLEGTTLEAA